MKNLSRGQWKTDSNCMSYTHHILCCEDCGKKQDFVYEIKGQGKICRKCFFEILPNVFGCGDDFIEIRGISYIASGKSNL